MNRERTEYILMNESDFISAKLKDRISVKDVLKFFVQYMKNDQLGMIANAHLGINLLRYSILTMKPTQIITPMESKTLDALVCLFSHHRAANTL
jgi:hypothetical protein